MASILRIVGDPRAAAAVALLGSGALASAQVGTTDLMLTAQIRDFESHPDFCRDQTVGRYWVEGSVAPRLDAQGRPVYTAQGRRITAPATDAAGNAIAGGLIAATPPQPPPPAVVLTRPAMLSNNPTIDTYNPALGPYSAANRGDSPGIGTGEPMPLVTVPTIGNYTSEYIRDGNAATTLNSSFRCDKFQVSNSHRVTVVGHVTVIVAETFVVENYSKIELAPGARLTVYALKDAKFHNNCAVNMNTWDPSRFLFYKMGTLDVYLQNSADVCGTFVCPDGRVSIANSADLFGWVTSKNLSMQNSAGLHVPAEPMSPPCSVRVDDEPPVLGVADAAGVASAQTFGQWFRDVPGVNDSAQGRLLFSKDETGAWEYEANDFRPIDGELLGAGTPGANRNFTLDLNGRFDYIPCSGQFFEFEGDGDALVFVDGQLVLELTGNNAGVRQYVDLDRLGLDPETPHTLQFFYAQRSCSPSRFHVRTSINLDTTYQVRQESVSTCD